MAAKRFTATIDRQGPGGAWTSIAIPFSVEQAFGSRGATKVKGTLNGAPFRSSLFPNGDGTHHLMMNKALLAAARAGPGDAVEVALEPDTAERVYAMPPDLATAVKRSKAASATWAAFPPSAHKLYVEWVEGAKREETRASRVEKAVALLSEGKKLK
ncbi:MAG TPA: YdeI/OmpD-associated family protein [Candidatus Thermoplasmatota archaeon]|nr:YdeI/OmpD-associated family protein [Candidatus Thermoplasmatota archaeon]